MSMALKSATGADRPRPRASLCPRRPRPDGGSRGPRSRGGELFVDDEAELSARPAALAAAVGFGGVGQRVGALDHGSHLPDLYPGPYLFEIRAVRPYQEGPDPPAAPEARHPPRREASDKRVHGDEDRVRLQHPAGFAEREHVYGVEDGVVASLPGGGVLAGVVQELVRPEAADEISVAPAGDRRYPRT